MKKLIVLIMLCLIGMNCFADDAHGVIEPYLGGFRIQDCDSIEMTDEVVDEYKSGYAYGSDSIGYSWKTWTYILTTGSSWANNIQKATIIFHSTYEYQWKNYTVERYSDQKAYIWNIDKMTYHYSSFSYKPTSIKYDKKAKETVITWVLKDIKPTEEWEAEELNSLIHSPSNWKQEFAYFLVKDDLYKIPGYEKKIKWWLDEGYSDESAVKKVYKDLSDKKEFYEWVKELYDTGFTEFQPKSKEASIFAQFLINSIYAMHGYEFKSEKWTKLFSNFSWYKSTTSSISEKDLTSEEKAMIKRLTQYR